MADAVATIQPPLAAASQSSALRRCFFIILVVGCLLRIAWVGRPLDYRLANAWRECDYTQIARNFYREGMNIFYPRIDWRGDTLGYVESEFPLLPWLAAACNHLFGYREQYLRIFSALLSVGGFFIFAKLARAMLPPNGALFAVAAFAVNPLLIRFATAMQPEPLMMFWSLLAFLYIWQWYQRPSPMKLIAAAALIAAATLAKAPAAILGLVFAYAVLCRVGLRAFRQPSLYVAALVAIGPPVLWYTWTKHFWTQYGNSLGLSNESHWLTVEVLKHPALFLGIFKWETLAVLSPFGWLFLLAALRFRGKEIPLAWAWFAAAWVFYIAAAGTCGDDWASYYHCISVIPSCLLVGAGFAAMSEHREHVRWRKIISARPSMIAKMLAIACLINLILFSFVAIYRRDYHEDLHRMYRSAVELAPSIPADGRIVVRGGDLTDEFGQPVAFNEPMLFAWMDRKGFSYPKSDMTTTALDAIAARGGRYWVAHAHELARGGLEREANLRYLRIAQSGEYTVYDLSAAPTR